MKRLNAFWFSVAVFGSYHAWWAISQFGRQALDADMPPVPFYVCAVWICVRNVCSYTLLVSASVCLLGRFSRALLTAIFGFIVAVTLAESYATAVFHVDLPSVVVSLVLNSSWTEMCGFIGMLLSDWRLVAALVAMVSLVAAFWIVLGRVRYPLVSRRSFLIGCGLLLPFFLFNVIFIGNWHSGISQMPYTSFPVVSASAWMKSRGFRKAGTCLGAPERVGTKAPRSELPDVVIVIGESATRNNWHLYGYPRHTSPRMDALCAAGEVVAFSDVVGIAPDTAEALGFLLTDVTFEKLAEGRWTMAEILRRAGYRTVLLSNQDAWGGGDESLLSGCFNGCIRRIRMSVASGGRKQYDETLVRFLGAELSQEKPVAVFIHMAGMHFPMQGICPPGDAHFTDEVESSVLNGLSAHDRDRRNRYDDGILYEDKVLGLFVDALRRTGRPSILYFISDHGESPRSHGWRVYSDRDLYEVPCVIWMSVAFTDRFADTDSAVRAAKDHSLQPDEMTCGILELAQVVLPADIPVTQSFLHPRFRGRMPRKIDKGRQDY